MASFNDCRTAAIWEFRVPVCGFRALRQFSRLVSVLLGSLRQIL